LHSDGCSQISNVPLSQGQLLKIPFGSILLNRLSFILFALFLISTNTNAEENGGSEGYKKLEPFTVNLAGMNKVVQVSVTLKLSTPNVEDKIKLYMPAIQNEIILLLSSKTTENLQTSDSKLQLISEIKNATNKVLDLTSKEGVADVLLDSFLIQ
jgi:flagellar basal body-associated protein FliL